MGGWKDCAGFSLRRQAVSGGSYREEEGSLLPGLWGPEQTLPQRAGADKRSHAWAGSGPKPRPQGAARTLRQRPSYGTGAGAFLGRNVSFWTKVHLSSSACVAESQGGHHRGGGLRTGGNIPGM